MTTIDKDKLRQIWASLDLDHPDEIIDGDFVDPPFCKECSFIYELPDGGRVELVACASAPFFDKPEEIYQAEYTDKDGHYVDILPIVNEKKAAV